MRVKTEERRQAILAVAWEVFREKGFAAASMAEMSARLGGSKGTLYGYFSSKEELFTALMLSRAALIAQPVFDLLQGKHDVAQVLRTFARELVRLLVSAEVVDFRRIIIAEGFRSELGRLFYENGPRRQWQLFETFFAAHVQAGFFQDAAPRQAAMHFEALLGAGPAQRQLEGVIEALSDEDIEATADAAVDVFLRAYAREHVNPPRARHRKGARHFTKRTRPTQY